MLTRYFYPKIISFPLLVLREGFEPPTCGIEARCSNPLSYRSICAAEIIIPLRRAVSLSVGNGPKLSEMTNFLRYARYQGMGIILLKTHESAESHEYGAESFKIGNHPVNMHPLPLRGQFVRQDALP